MTFSLFVKRFVQYSREEVEKLRIEVTSDDDAFREFGSLYCPLPAKLHDIPTESNSTVVEIREKENTKNLLFIVKALTFALKRQRELEDREAQQFAFGAAAAGTKITSQGMMSFADMQLIMARNHAPALIVEMLAYTRYTKVVEAALIFGSEVFANGNQACQDALVLFLTYSKARPYLFANLGHIIDHFTASRKEVNVLRRAQSRRVARGQPGGKDQELRSLSLTPPPLLIYELYRFLQLLCEGHYAPLQEMMDMREGSEVGLLTASLNLLNEFIAEDLHLMKEEDCAVAHSIMSFMVESTQGPCYRNQEALASQPIFWEVVDRIWRFSKCNRWDIKKEKLHKKIDLKTMLVDGDGPICYRGEKMLKNMAMILRTSLTEGRKITRTDPVFKIMLNYSTRYVFDDGNAKVGFTLSFL